MGAKVAGNGGGKFIKGTPKPPNSGRKKGVPNKATVSVKAAFEEAFQNRGGVAALTAWAREEPTEFYKLYAKLLPVQINGEIAVNGTLAESLNRAKARMGGTLLTGEQEGAE